MSVRLAFCLLELLTSRRGLTDALPTLAMGLSRRACAARLSSSLAILARILASDGASIPRMTSEVSSWGFNNSVGGSYLLQSVGSCSETVDTTGVKIKYDGEVSSSFWSGFGDVGTSKNSSSVLFDGEAEFTFLGTRSSGFTTCVFNRGYGNGVDMFMSSWNSLGQFPGMEAIVAISSMLVSWNRYRTVLCEELESSLQYQEKDP